jgi:hypothetical protein
MLRLRPYLAEACGINASMLEGLGAPSCVIAIYGAVVCGWSADAYFGVNALRWFLGL